MVIRICKGAEVVNKSMFTGSIISVKKKYWQKLIDALGLSLGEKGKSVSILLKWIESDEEKAFKGLGTAGYYKLNDGRIVLQIRFIGDTPAKMNEIFNYSVGQINQGIKPDYESIELFLDEDSKIIIINCIIMNPKVQNDANEPSQAEQSEETAVTGAENRIFYGTPGCGKSQYLKKKLESEGFDKVVRTVFYSDYTYSDFVGQIYPHIEGKRVTYEFVSGPFTVALDYALQHPNEKVALVIEEINRGNAPAIFGELFQLLDRIRPSDDDTAPAGRSEYKITDTLLQDELPLSEGEEVFIPANLFIYATMNTSDQNVFTLDTAFKRRWKMTKIRNDFTDDDTIRGRKVPGFGITWERFVKATNEHIIATASSLNAEDKQIGKYFVTESDLVGENDTEEIIKAKAKEFAEKVLEYLWSDVAKFNRSAWFSDAMKSFDAVLDAVESGAIETIFADELKNKLWPEQA